MNSVKGINVGEFFLETRTSFCEEKIATQLVKNMLSSWYFKEHISLSSRIIFIYFSKNIFS